MKINVLLIILLFCLYYGGSAAAQAVQHTYRFYDNLEVAQPECGPALTQEKSAGACPAGAVPGSYIEDVLPCGARRKVYHSNSNWGLRYHNDDGLLGASYTIQMYVKVTDWGTTWTRIIDFSNGRQDDGIYFKDKDGSTEKCLDFYPNGIIGTCPYFNNSTYYLLTFTRDGNTGIMNVYVDDTLFATYNDTQEMYVAKAGLPIFLFRDDEIEPCESGAVNLAYLSFSSKHTGASEVAQNFRDICFIANINSYADFSISPNPSCGFPQNITVTYTGKIAAPGTDYSFMWEWDGARVISGSGMGPYVVSWDSGGTKNVALTVTNTKCGNSLYNRKEAIITNLDLTTNVESGSCDTGADGTVTLRGLGGEGPYRYSLDSVNYQRDSVFRMAVGDYRVYIRDENECTVAKTVSIRFTSDIALSTIADTTVCEGESVQLSAAGNAREFAWLPADGLDDASGREPVATPAVTTSYVVTATKGFCTQTDKVTVNVSPKIQLFVTPDATADYNVPFQLLASSPQIPRPDDAQFVWSPETGLNNPRSPSPIAVLQDNQSYTVEVTSPLGCKGSGSVNLSIRRRENILVPGAFTPDGDGRNEILVPVLNQIQSITYFKIYDRWGRLIFFTDEMNAGWNGTIEGRAPLAGVYSWTIEGISNKGETISKKGSVILIK